MSNLDQLTHEPADDDRIEHLARMAMEYAATDPDDDAQILFRLNHSSFMGQFMGAVLVRLRDAETKLREVSVAGRRDTALKLARDFEKWAEMEDDDARRAAYDHAAITATTHAEFAAAEPLPGGEVR
ncbi:hypothetical protein FAF44_02985 [Nonomuraea sp. MG754425]|uniref:hypothetical protein n=1 Tax=Nonomuraea sp. MG754425 TaxID=2570319 RepID=UPI001F24C429|nr:hypothetical protein [Nonomuraea sp. MG754425]MCF6467380.1 hypothetical protein [Nonomuraea sp. MG754425]